MKYRTCFALALAVFASGGLHAATIAFQFQPQLVSGSDPNGLAGATWTFEFTITQAQYALSGSFNDTAFSSSSALLTIAGSGNSALNGPHAITSNGPDGHFVFIADLFGGTQVALEGPGNTTSGFSFGGVNVSNFGGTAPSFGSPAVGDAVDVEPFNALSYANGGFTAGSGNFSFTSSPVPEPSSLVMSLPALAILFRRKKPKTA